MGLDAVGELIVVTLFSERRFNHGVYLAAQYHRFSTDFTLDINSRDDCSKLLSLKFPLPARR